MSKSRWMTIALVMLTCGVLLGSGCGKQEARSTAQAKRIKIGFINPNVTEPWFREEHRFAQTAADELGFDLVKLTAKDGDVLMADIDNLGTQGAQGVIICAPDVKLGPAIVARCKAQGLKLMTVDDQLTDADGKILKDVPHMGIAAYDIGLMVGEALWTEMQRRGWKIEDTAAMGVSWSSVETSKVRTDAAMEALVKHGFPKEQFHALDAKTDDIAGGQVVGDAMVARYPTVKHWLICSQNDEGVLGAVRATEAHYSPEDVIGVGIGGSTGLVDFKRDKPTGFFGSIMIKPRLHGHDTSVMMYHWIKDGTAPPPITTTKGELITRADYKEKMQREGLLD